MSESTLNFCRVCDGGVTARPEKGAIRMAENTPRATARRTSGKTRVAEVVYDLLEPIAEQNGYRLWNVAYVREGADYVLRLTIDKPDASGAISVDDCEIMSHAADPILDEADPIGQAYLLEVESPGLERELCREEHFALCAGETVELKLFAPLEGRRSFTGILRGLDADRHILLDTPDGQLSFPRTAVSRAHVVFDFDSL